MKLTRIAAGLAAVSMLAVVSSQIAFAEDGVTLTAEKVTVAQGNDFTLKIDLSGVPENGVSASEFAVTYDASVITITGATAGDIVNTASDGFDEIAVFDADYSEAGRITVAYGTIGETSTWVKTDGTFLTITGTASGAAGSSTDVTVTAVNRPYHDDSKLIVDEIYVGSVDDNGTVANYTVSAVAGSVTISGENPPSSMKGDVNLDGVVDIRDVVYANRVVLGKDSVEGDGFLNADIDGDGIIAPADALNIMKFVVGLITEF